MFDRLIESDTVGADFKSRRRYFLVSTIVVGALFVSAVVFSIYASEIGLGSEEFEVAAILAPVEAATEAPQSRDRQQQTTNHKSDDLPTRTSSQQRPDETPVGVPPVSTVKTTSLSRPYGDYRIDRFDSDPGGAAGPVGPEPGPSGPSQPAGYIVPNRDDTENEATPPPAIKRAAVKHIAVVNGLAIDLPKPPYPATAIAMHIDGKVDIQVTIDETGKVISAKAASGHPFLRAAAETAAWKARFTPTMLNGAPVKVTGMIVYNFTRN